jgi:hypothetical protein
MATKLLSALIFSATLIVPSVAIAAQDKCPAYPTLETPGDYNKLIKDTYGSEGFHYRARLSTRAPPGQ